jgi:hypothetical protein
MRCRLVVCGTVNQRGQQRESEIYDCVDRETRRLFDLVEKIEKRGRRRLPCPVRSSEAIERRSFAAFASLPIGP